MAIKNFKIEHLTYNTDVRVGDMLVTFDLDGRFNKGYLVAVVSAVTVDSQRVHTVIQTLPTANIQRLHYLLSLYGTDHSR